MATQKAAGLDAAQVDKLRGALASGARPRVQLPASQFGAGTTGTVLRMGDPAVDGDDYVTVQVKVAGVIDELGFAPDELAMPTRKRAAKQQPAAPPTPAPAQTPAARAGTSAKPAPLKAQAVKATPKATPAKTPPAKAPAASAAKAPAASPSRRPSRSGRGSSAPAVTITIASEGASWTLSAQRGPRSLLRKTPVMPGVVAAIAGLFEQPDLERAIADVNDASRAEAEAHAERLRAELAEVEAVLSSHRRP
jgi:hypothetical protein